MKIYITEISFKDGKEPKDILDVKPPHVGCIPINVKRQTHEGWKHKKGHGEVPYMYTVYTIYWRRSR